MALPEFFFERVCAEIRQQMDGMQALAGQLARMRLAPDAEACADGVADAAAGVRRTLDLALDLKFLATGELKLNQSSIRLRALADEIQARWEERAAQLGVTLLVSYDGDPEGCVATDAVRLREVFDGFIGEAVAGSRGGSVEVTLKAVPAIGGVTLQGGVRGGRDAAWRAQPLETRIREVEARLGLEVALGVVLARRLLTLLSGKVVSEPADNTAAGSLFELTLPTAAESPAMPPKPDPTLRPGHILVVDDNATNRVVAQALCEMLNCTSEAAEDGVEAVEAAEDGRFDAILMDIRMPRMDGVTATRAIRKLPGKAGSVPIVALTANVEPDDAQAYLAAGMNGVLEKPIKAEHLKAALKDVLGKPRRSAAA